MRARVREQRGQNGYPSLSRRGIRHSASGPLASSSAIPSTRFRVFLSVGRAGFAGPI